MFKSSSIVSTLIIGLVLGLAVVVIGFVKVSSIVSTLIIGLVLGNTVVLALGTIGAATIPATPVPTPAIPIFCLVVTFLNFSLFVNADNGNPSKSGSE